MGGKLRKKVAELYHKLSDEDGVWEDTKDDVPPREQASRHALATCTRPSSRSSASWTGCYPHTATMLADALRVANTSHQRSVSR